MLELYGSVMFRLAQSGPSTEVPTVDFSSLYAKSPCVRMLSTSADSPGSTDEKRWKQLGLNLATCRMAVAGNFRLQQELEGIAKKYYMVKAERYMRRLPVTRCMLHGLADYANEYTNTSWTGRQSRPTSVSAKDLGSEIVRLVYRSARRTKCSVPRAKNIAKVLIGQPEDVVLAIPSETDLELHLDAINAADKDKEAFMRSQGQDLHYDTILQRIGVANPRVEIRSLPSLKRDQDQGQGQGQSGRDAGGREL